VRDLLLPEDHGVPALEGASSCALGPMLEYLLGNTFGTPLLLSTIFPFTKR